MEQKSPIIFEKFGNIIQIRAKGLHIHFFSPITEIVKLVRTDKTPTSYNFSYGIVVKSKRHSFESSIIWIYSDLCLHDKGEN